MKIELEVDLGSSVLSDCPYWLIIDPDSLTKKDIKDNPDYALHKVASMITGPFFSREEAESHLKQYSYNFGKLAKVYCHSGYQGYQYRMACRNARESGVSDEQIK
jgi:hypothetical protein